MAAVHTCTPLAPIAINSVASLQFEIPPIAEIGRLFVSGSFAISVTMCNAIGLTAGPQ